MDPFVRVVRSVPAIVVCFSGAVNIAKPAASVEHCRERSIELKTENIHGIMEAYRTSDRAQTARLRETLCVEAPAQTAVVLEIHPVGN